MNLRLTLGLATVFGVLVAVLLPALSHATPSSRNGKIAYLSNAVGAIDPVGGPETTLVGGCSTPSCRSAGLTWSRNGAKLAFVRGYLPGGGAGPPPPNPPKVALFVFNARTGHLRRLLGCGECGVGSEPSESWSPGGSRIVVSDGRRLALVNVKTRSHKLAGPRCKAGYDASPAWSPEGSKIAFGCGASLYVAARTGRHAHVIATVPGNAFVAHISWSPGGKTIAFDDPNSIYTVGADGSDLKTLRTGQPGDGPEAPAWSPDGTRILYVNTPGVPNDFFVEVWVMNANGTHNHRLFHSGGPLTFGYTAAVWSPDGTQIAFSLGTTVETGLMIMNADGTNLHRIAPPVDELAWQPLP